MLLSWVASSNSFLYPLVACGHLLGQAGLQQGCLSAVASTFLVASHCFLAPARAPGTGHETGGQTPPPSEQLLARAAPDRVAEVKGPLSAEPLSPAGLLISHRAGGV